MKARRNQQLSRRVAALGGLVLVGLGGLVALLTAGPSFVIPGASATTAGQLYFTTFRPPTVDEVTFGERDGRLHLSARRVVARLPGADGVLFGPDGRLLVGGVREGRDYSVDPATGDVQAIPTGIPNSMHLVLSPGGTVLYTSGEPGPLAEIPLGAAPHGHEIPLHGSTTKVTALAFGPGGQVVYTRSAPGGRGEIGLVDLSTGLMRRLFTNVVGAHGIVYDPWSRSYLVVGGDVLRQLPASDPGHLESELVVPGNRFDQAAVTGHGQVLIASNFGKLVLVDYAKSGRVGALANPVSQVYLAKNLDDVAPLVGPGARPVPTSAHLRRVVGGAALGTSAAVLCGTGTVFGLRRRKRRKRARTLPRWDRRRRPSPGSQPGGRG